MKVYIELGRNVRKIFLNLLVTELRGKNVRVLPTGVELREEIRGFWKSDETLFRVFGISSQSKQKLMNKRRNKILKL